MAVCPAPNEEQMQRVRDVCERLTNEPHLGLSEILRQAGIARRTFHDWRQSSEEVEALYAEAKASGYDALAQQCLEIADDSPLSQLRSKVSAIIEQMKIEEDGAIFEKLLESLEGLEGQFKELVAERKLRVETRMKLLAKWFPERYGEAMTLRGDKNNPLQTETRSSMSDEQLEDILRRSKKGGDGKP